jgi:2-polyprenyl-3-methyl-5-hydroxy-6-metoxy-1,4-benzoquinol methylase
MTALDTVARLRNRSTRTHLRPALRLTPVQLAARDRVLDAYASKWSTEEVSCLCGASKGTILTERDRYGLPCRSVLCSSCGVVRTSPRLDEVSLTAFYETDYRTLYSGASQPTDLFFSGLVRKGEGVRDFLGARLFEGAVVVDVGCGAGGALLPFRDAGCRVYGCDIGDEYLQRGRNQGLDLRQGSYDVLADAAPFDLVVLSHVLEHIPDFGPFLAGLRPLMATEGLLYIELPGITDVSNQYGDPLGYFQNAHLWSFDLTSLTASMGREGWRLVQGTEFIRAAFVQSEHVDTCASSYEANLRVLAIAERTRLLHSSRIRLRHSRWRPTRSRIRKATARLRSVGRGR